MNDRITSDFVHALRRWLHDDQLGDDANIFYQGSVIPCQGASGALRFTITVPAPEISDLYLLSKFRGLVRSGSTVLTIVQIVPVGPISAQLRHARRDFILHIRGGA